MPKLLVEAFGGVRPRWSRTLGTVQRATVAENVLLWHGDLTPLRTPKLVHTALDCVRSLFVDECTVLTDQSACASFATGRGKCKRVFATGLCEFPFPVTATLPVCSSLADQHVLDWRRLGVVAPVAVTFVVPALSAPLPAPSQQQGFQIEREQRDYVITYVNSFGEESHASPGSPSVQDADHSAVATLTIGPRPDPALLWNVTAVRVYRMMTGTEDGTYTGEAPTYSFVEEIDVTGIPWGSPVTFVDDVPASELGEGPPEYCVQPPPEDLRGITELESGPLVGFVGKKLWFTAPFQYHNWECSLELDDCIRGIREVDHVVYVATDGAAYSIDARPPEGDCLCCRTVFKHSEPAPLVSDMRGMVTVPQGVLWPSHDGLVRVSGNAMTVITHTEMAEDDWIKHYPAHMVVGNLNGRAYMFSPHSLVYDYSDSLFADGDVGANSRLTTLTYNVEAVFTDRTGRMYIATGDQVQAWAEGDTNEVFRWRGRLVHTDGAVNWSAARLFFGDRGCKVSDTEAVMFTLYCGSGKPLFSKRVVTDEPFRLPANIKHNAVEFEIRGTNKVTRFIMATSMRELAMGSDG